MGDSIDPVALDYRSPPQRLSRRPRPCRTPIEWRWLGWRFAYYLARVGLFLLIAFRIGPNVWNFGKLTMITPADFVSVVQRDGIPVVRAIKRYQRDTGKFPRFTTDIPADYLAPDPSESREISNGEVSIRTRTFDCIVYNFTPGQEGWSVRGYFTNGPIPITPRVVDISDIPMTQPATQPATLPATNP